MEGSRIERIAWLQQNTEDAKVFNEKIGNALQAVRLSRNISYEDLALYLKVSISYIKQWECGRKPIPLRYAIKICNYFNCTIDELLLLSVGKYRRNMRRLSAKHIAMQREVIHTLIKHFSILQLNFVIDSIRDYRDMIVLKNGYFPEKLSSEPEDLIGLEEYPRKIHNIKETINNYIDLPVGEMNKKIGKQIRKLKCTYGFSVQELADMLELSCASVNFILNGNRGLTLKNMLKLCRIFNLPMEQIIIDCSSEAIGEDSSIQKIASTDDCATLRFLKYSLTDTETEYLISIAKSLVRNRAFINNEEND